MRGIMSVYAKYRGIIRLLILYVLREKPLHGYGIMKELKEIMGKMPGPGNIYPQIRYLLRRNYIEIHEEIQEGRRRKVYRITEKGLKYLEENMDRVNEAIDMFSRLKCLFDYGFREIMAELWVLIKVWDKVSEEDKERVKELIACMKEELAKILVKYTRETKSSS